MSRYLVTGASGFVAGRLIEALKQQGHFVRVLLRCGGDDNAQLWDEVYRCDLEAPIFPDGLLKDIDVVLHLAALSKSTAPESLREKYNRVNALSTVALATLAAESDVKSFVFLSSVKASASQGEAYSDDFNNPKPADVYGLSKYKAEQGLIELSRSSKMKISVLRPAAIYGKGSSGSVGLLINAVRKGVCPPIPNSPVGIRSMVSVDDVVAAILLASTRASDGIDVYTLADDGVYTSREIYESIHRVLGKKAPGWAIPLVVFRWVGVAGDCVKATLRLPFPFTSDTFDKLFSPAVYDSKKIREELGWKPLDSLENTLLDAF